MLYASLVFRFNFTYLILCFRRLSIYAHICLPCQRVRDPAHGFFVAGSSLPALNGIYGRVRNEHVQFLSGVGGHRPVRLAYRHDKTGWLMVLVDITPEERPDSEEEDADVRYGLKEPCDM